MFMRFIVEEVDESSLARAGVFVVAYRLKAARALPELDHHRLLELLQWFDQNLNMPTRLNRSRRHNRRSKAISWFKPTAAEHIRKARELSRIVSEHHVWVQQVTTVSPGYVVFEDAHQVVAEPFSPAGF
jgi:hypothetical protein